MEKQTRNTKVKPVVKKGPAASAPSAISYSAGDLPSVPIEKYKFQIPAKVRKENDPHTVVIKELTESEIDTASKIGGDNQRKIVQEMVKASIVEVDEHEVNHAEAEADAYWSRWSQKVRYQLIAGWRKINQTSEEEDALFFESMERV